MLIRNSDRFWYEGPDAGFTQEEIYEINNTTLSQVIARNTPNTYQLPPNIWIVQPSTSLKFFAPDPNDSNGTKNSTSPLISADYPPLNHITLSNVYEVYWKIIDDEIHFKLVIASSNAWFAIGFNDRDSMMTSDMIIFRNNDNDVEVMRYEAVGYFTPKLLDEQDKFVKVIRTVVKSGVYTLVEISRPLVAKGSKLKSITGDRLISSKYKV